MIVGNFANSSCHALYILIVLLASLHQRGHQDVHAADETQRDGGEGQRLHGDPLLIRKPGMPKYCCGHGDGSVSKGPCLQPTSCRGLLLQVREVVVGQGRTQCVSQVCHWNLNLVTDSGLYGGNCSNRPRVSLCSPVHGPEMTGPRDACQAQTASPPTVQVCLGCR